MGIVELDIQIYENAKKLAANDEKLLETIVFNEAKKIRKKQKMDIETKQDLQFMNKILASEDTPVPTIEQTPIDNIKEEIETNYILNNVGEYYLSADRQIVDIIKPGFYDLRYDYATNQLYIAPKQISIDELYDLDSEEFNKIREDVYKFMSDEMKNHFKKYNYTYKRGYLLHGKQGVGKTCLINMFALKFLKEGQDVIIFHISAASELNNYIKFITGISKREPNKMFFFILEDIDACLKHSEIEGQLINFLDGIDQVSGVITFATTNHPELLEARITNRPNRFDRRVEIPLPDEKVRMQYFAKKFELLDEEDKNNYDIEKFVSDMEGFTIAHCQELFKSIVMFKHDYNDTINILKKMNETEQINSAKINKNKIGF